MTYKLTPDQQRRGQINGARRTKHAKESITETPVKSVTERVRNPAPTWYRGEFKPLVRDPYALAKLAMEINR